MDWGQAMRMLHNSRVMRAHEALGSMITGRSTGPLASIQHGLLGLDFASPYLSNYGDDDYCDDDYDEEDDDDDDNDEEDDDYYHSDRTWKDNSHSQLVPHPRIKQLTPEEAEKHAKDLLKEEERRKEKAEKKRQKKIRQKEKRRLEKLNADKDNELPDDKAQGQPTSENQGETVDTHYIRETNEPLVDGPGPIRTKTEVTSPEERNCGNVVVEEDGALARESEELDMNSSFISTAAAIAKKQFDQKRESKEKRKKKKKDHAQQSEEKDEKPKIQEEERPEVQEEEKPEVQEEERPEVQEPQQVVG